jgi:hypothetical protein
MNPLTETQLSFNRSSRDCWELFHEHRRRTTELLSAGAGRLCVLGAGNGNDLDLPALRRHYDAIHLVDLDAEALRHGLAAQPVADGVTAHGGIDATGVLDALPAWSGRTPISEDDLLLCRDRPREQVAPRLPGPFDVVASTCLLSQLVHAVVHSVGERHPRFLDVVKAVRLGHLYLMTALLAPGGTGLLISDVVSSDTVPPLASIPEDVFAEELTRIIDAHNHFHGVNPFVVEPLFRSDPVLARQTADVRLLRPWRWRLTEWRTYAVWAIRFRRAPS